MKIEIRYEKFNGEFEADIEISHEEIRYLASDNIKTLFNEIAQMYLKIHETSGAD